MKAQTWILVGLFSLIPNVKAQVVEGAVKNPAPTVSAKPSAELTAPATPKIRSETLRGKAVYGGFVPELVRTNNRSALLSLRKSNDPKRDLTNIVRDPVTQQTVGFRLFSIDF